MAKTVNLAQLLRQRFPNPNELDRLYNGAQVEIRLRLVDGNVSVEQQIHQGRDGDDFVCLAQDRINEAAVRIAGETVKLKGEKALLITFKVTVSHHRGTTKFEHGKKTFTTKDGRSPDELSRREQSLEAAEEAA